MNAMKKTIIYIVAASVLALSGCSGEKSCCKKRSFIAHRGVDLHCTVAGENSLEAVGLAARAGFDAVETDVRLTADSVLVVMHDATLRRTCLTVGGEPVEKDVAVADLTMEQLRRDYRLKASEPKDRSVIPTLKEYLLCCRENGVKVFIEPKLKDSTGRFYAMIMDEADEVFGRGNYIVTSNNFANGIIRDRMNVTDVPLMGILYQTTYEDISSVSDIIIAVSATRFSGGEYYANVERAKGDGFLTESHADDYERFAMVNAGGVDWVSTDMLAPDDRGLGKDVGEGEKVGFGAVWLDMTVQGSATVKLARQTFEVKAEDGPLRVRHQLLLYDEYPSFEISDMSDDFRIISKSIRIAEL